MEILDPATWQPLKDALSFFRDAVGLAKDAKGLLKEGPEKEAISQALAKAESSASLAEAQIAKALGYPLCRCTFPPQIMLASGRHLKRDLLTYKCASCGNQEPSEAYFARLDEEDRIVRNRRSEYF